MVFLYGRKIVEHMRASFERLIQTSTYPRSVAAQSRIFLIRSFPGLIHGVVSHKRRLSAAFIAIHDNNIGGPGEIEKSAGLLVEQIGLACCLWDREALRHAPGARAAP